MLKSFEAYDEFILNIFFHPQNWQQKQIPNQKLTSPVFRIRRYSLKPDPDPAKNLNPDPKTLWIRIRIQAISKHLEYQNYEKWFHNYNIFS